MIPCSYSIVSFLLLFKTIDYRLCTICSYIIFHYFIFNSRLLQSLFLLISSPSTTSIPKLFGSVRSLLQKLLTTHHGLLFLGSKPEVVSGILKSLVQPEAGVCIFFWCSKCRLVLLNPVALRMAKTQLSFGQSECNRV